MDCRTTTIATEPLHIGHDRALPLASAVETTAAGHAETDCHFKASSFQPGQNSGSGSGSNLLLGNKKTTACTGGG